MNMRSTSSFWMGSMPAWWKPTPRRARPRTSPSRARRSSWKSPTSSSCSASMRRASSGDRSSRCRFRRARRSQSLRLKQKTRTGRSPRSWSSSKSRAGSGPPGVGPRRRTRRPPWARRRPFRRARRRWATTWASSSEPRGGEYRRWERGTGRRRDSITASSCSRISSIQAPSSPMLEIVADRQMIRMRGGAKISASSHTVPRSGSSRKCTSSKIAYSTSDSFSGSSKMALRRISVVMIRTCAPGWMVTSPVIRPASTRGSSRKSRYFWLDRALMGAV